MDGIEHIKSYGELALNRREILRYAGARELSPEQKVVLDECLAELLPRISYHVCWRFFPVKLSGRNVDLGFARIESTALSRNLAECRHIVLFAATLGLEPDRLIAKYGRISPAKALFCQAIGAERIESLCDAFCQEMEAQEGKLHPRFSPGYGDVSLELQKDIFDTLDCPRKIGLTLTDSLLMSPSKSVTALAGF